MHRETISGLIENGSGMLGSFLKELFIHRKEMQQMEKKKDLELELARARGEAKNGAEPTEPQASAPKSNGQSSVGLAGDLSAAFDDLKARESCGVCEELLDAIEQADHETQVIALTEYGRLKHMVEAGASEGEIRNVLEESETLADLLEQQVAA